MSDLATLSLSLYLQGETGACTCHATGMQDAYVSAKGELHAGHVRADADDSDARVPSGVEVLAPNAQAVVVLGDSISDGVGSTRARIAVGRISSPSA